MQTPCGEYEDENKQKYEYKKNFLESSAQLDYNAPHMWYKNQDSQRSAASVNMISKSIIDRNIVFEILLLNKN